MQEKAIIQTINLPLFKKHNIQVQIKRDDLIHTIISGNKWRKLKFNLIHAKKHNKGILSFGGAYSNHIHALAFACKQQNINSTAIIRGECEYANNFTLSCAKKWGMKLDFVDRKTYKRRFDPLYLEELQQQYPNYYFIPEGGSNELALPGVGEVIHELNQQTEYESLLLPVGSGGTLAGLITADKNQHQLIGIGVLKQCQYLIDEVQKLLPIEAKAFSNWQIMSEYHRGGYAKFNQQDCQRIIEFNTVTGINVEPVYSGKMILALLDLVKIGYFPAGHKVMLLHTGGLQGLAGLAERQVINADNWDIPKLCEQL